MLSHAKPDMDDADHYPEQAGWYLIEGYCEKTYLRFVQNRTCSRDLLSQELRQEREDATSREHDWKLITAARRGGG